MKVQPIAVLGFQRLDEQVVERDLLDDFVLVGLLHGVRPHALWI